MGAEVDAREIAALTAHARGELVPERMNCDRLAAFNARGDQHKPISRG